MDLLVLVVIASLIGFVVYLITTNVPMPAGYARAIQVVVLIVLLLFLLSRVVAIPNFLH
jgi:hypothetical protein